MAAGRSSGAPRPDWVTRGAGRGCSGARGASTLIEGNFQRAPAQRAGQTADQGPSHSSVLRRPGRSLRSPKLQIVSGEVVET